MLRLTVKKGSFAYDPQLGSEIYKLAKPLRVTPQNERRLALSYAQEALLPIPGVTAEKAEISFSGPGAMKLSLRLNINQNPYELEVEYDLR